MSTKFSYIITYRDSEERRNNLFLVLDWLKEINCEIILVEQDSEKKLNFEDLNIKHIFIYSLRPFNRSWGFNVGSNLASYDKLVFGDADIIMSKENLLESVATLNDINVVSPYQRVTNLTIEETLYYNENRNLPKSSENIRPDSPLAGGIVMINKSDFEYICGWCEEFEGWGGEDDFMTWKIDAWLKSISMPFDAFHLWHPIAVKDEIAYESNLDILRKCEQSSSEEIVNWILETKNKIGNPDKFK